MGDIRMTEEQLQALLAANSEATIKTVMAAMPQGQIPAHLADLLPKQQSEEEAFAAAMRRPVADRVPAKQEFIPCRTGKNATFLAVVSHPLGEDGKPHVLWPHGRVSELRNYREPEFVTEGKHDSLNGNGSYCVPKGMPMVNTGSGKGAGQITVQFKNWRWHEFFQKDLGMYVGVEPRMLPRDTQTADKAAE
jgi:hypothetical protein